MMTSACTLFPNLGSRHVRTLRVALRLFTEKGFFNTSIQAIVGEADVSIGFIYHNFSDKEGIARALYHHLLGRMNVLIDEIETRCHAAKDRCSAVIRMLFELTESEPDVMNFVINARHREFLPEEPAICSASAFVRMRSFVLLGIESGEVRAINPVIASATMYGGAIRMICLRLDGIIPLSLDHYVEELWENTWTALERP